MGTQIRDVKSGDGFRYQRHAGGAGGGGEHAGIDGAGGAGEIIDDLDVEKESLEIGGIYEHETDNPWATPWRVEIVDIKDGWVRFRTLDRGAGNVLDETVSGWFGKTFRRVK